MTGTPFLRGNSWHKYTIDLDGDGCLLALADLRHADLDHTGLDRLPTNYVAPESAVSRAGTRPFHRLARISLSK
jgi:hypothetical protein